MGLSILQSTSFNIRFVVVNRPYSRYPMSRGILGGKQKIKFAHARNRGRLCLFPQNETTIK